MFRGVRRIVTRAFEGDGTGDGDGSDDRDGGSAALYSCSRCGTTYISEDMEVCSQCEQPVEQVPDKFELGFDSS